MQVAPPARPHGRRPTLVLAAAALAVALPTLARAQSAGTKVGVVNVGAISGKLQEAKEVTAHLQNEQQQLDANVKAHQIQLDGIKQDLRNLKPDSSQFKTKFAELQDKGTQFQIEDQQTKNHLVQDLSSEKRQLFAEVQQTAAAIAKKRGIDLVIVMPDPTVPDSVIGMEPQQLDNLLNQKTVLYANPAIDLTDAVALQMDTDYKAKSAPGH